MTPPSITPKPVVLLISRLSASASEIVAGALKDYKRAIIVGDDNSFGKGTVQSVLHLFPGLGALKVTTGLFFRPGGYSTQQMGVKADIRASSIFNTPDYGEASLDYSLTGTKIPSFVSNEANSRVSGQRYKARHSKLNPKTLQGFEKANCKRRGF